MVGMIGPRRSAGNRTLIREARSSSVARSMVSPTPQQLALLTRRERFSFGVCDLVNRRRLLKRASTWFLRHIGTAWVDYCSRRLLTTDGLEQAQALRPPRGLLLVSNHRSFFDMYMISLVLF